MRTSLAMPHALGGSSTQPRTATARHSYSKPKLREHSMNAASDYFSNKVAIVTGGASGIGLALAETMLGYGAKQVVLADFNDENLKREAAVSGCEDPRIDGGEVGRQKRAAGDTLGFR